MATRWPVATPIAGGYLVQWHNLASNDVCMPWPLTGSPDQNLDPPDASVMTDRCAQLYGGTMGTVNIEGSNAIATSLATFATLHQVDGTTGLILTTTSPIQQILEATYFTRPNPTSAASGTSVSVKFVMAGERK